MTNFAGATIIGIDRGASFTDFAVIEDGRLTRTTSLETRDWSAITEAYEKMQARCRTGSLRKNASPMPDGARRFLRLGGGHAGIHAGTGACHC